MNDLLREHRVHHELLAGVLKRIATKQLKQSVGNEMGTLGMQFRHIADVESCYIQAIKSGVMDFSRKVEDHTIETDKDRLLAYFERNEEALKDELAKMVNGKQSVRGIDWSKTHQHYGVISVERHLLALIEHEVLHEGEIVVYLRTLGLKFPPSWRVWGLNG
jgi:uncharacterized damage-inducible protein DinB